LVRAVRSFDRAASLDVPQHFQKIGCDDGLDRTVADRGKHEPLQPAHDALGMIAPPLRGLPGMPFERDGLEGAFAGCGPLSLAHRARIAAVCNELAGRVALLAGDLQTHIRVDAKGKRLALVGIAVVQPPPSAALLAPCRGNQKVKAVAVGQLVGLFLWLGVADLRLGQHDGNLPRF